jgi:hypothetical protein
MIAPECFFAGRGSVSRSSTSPTMRWACAAVRFSPITRLSISTRNMVRESPGVSVSITIRSIIARAAAMSLPGIRHRARRQKSFRAKVLRVPDGNRIARTTSSSPGRNWEAAHSLARSKACASRPYLGALLLGYHGDDGKLCGPRRHGYVGEGAKGSTATPRSFGSTQITLKRSSPALNPLWLTACSVPSPWVEPKLVAEITYLTWTADNLLRQTVYAGLPEDKPAEQVRRER